MPSYRTHSLDHTHPNNLRPPHGGVTFPTPLFPLLPSPPSIVHLPSIPSIRPFLVVATAPSPSAQRWHGTGRFFCDGRIVMGPAIRPFVSAWIALTVPILLHFIFM